ncbi:MAG: DUF1573 domain-containing protein, partial [Planctomycetaceae bacterium]|nr:DUF1573 domain-containing protein [Planctomycetaceae bacterium]
MLDRSFRSRILPAVLLGVHIWGCSSSSETEPPIALSTGFDTTQVDLGVLYAGLDALSRTQTFHFTNVYSYPVRIKEIQSSCSCATAQHVETPIEPGQSVDIDLKLNLTSKNGKFETGVQVVFESPKATESVAVTCIGTLYPAMEVRNQFIDLGYVFGSDPPPSGSAVIRIPVTRERAFIDLIGEDQGDFAFQIVRDEEFTGLGDRAFRDVVVQAQLNAVGEPGTRHEGEIFIHLKRGPVENSVAVKARAIAGHEHCLIRPSQLFFHLQSEDGVYAEATLLGRESESETQITPHIESSTNDSVSIASVDQNGRVKFYLDTELAKSGEIVLAFAGTEWKRLRV